MHPMPDPQDPRVQRFIADVAAIPAERWPDVIRRAGDQDEPYSKSVALAWAAVQGTDSGADDEQRARRADAIAPALEQLRTALQPLPDAVRAPEGFPSPDADIAPLRHLADTPATNALLGIIAGRALPRPSLHVLLAPFANVLVTNAYDP